MDPRYRIGNTAFAFPDEGGDEIHVLVAIPGLQQIPFNNSKLQPHPSRKRKWEELNQVLNRNRKSKLQEEAGESCAYVAFKDMDTIMPTATPEMTASTCYMPVSVW